MTDIFEERAALPMLLESCKPFDSEDYIFELKLDGIRCLLYSDGKSVVLRNRKNNDMTSSFPELSDICGRISGKVILDGELVCLKNGKPDFYALQARDRYRATFAVFDVIYRDGEILTGKPLEFRKELLDKITDENEFIAVSRFISGKGKELFAQVEKKGLEGIVAKKKGSLYHMGKRSRDWLKIKCTKEEVFFLCGYTLYPDKTPKDLILGSQSGGKMEYRGKVFLGLSPQNRKRVGEFGKKYFSPHPPFPSEISAVWIVPEVKCRVEYLDQTESALRQPIFRGFEE